ncbi:MAG: 23S rRNA (adenine(2503)-C(2))-methyltransferase RlmN, partial [Spirochaetota bacterium]
PDGTRKYLFETDSGHLIETAVIPQGDRVTLCLSSQAGCARGCRFCATGRQGFQANLSVRDILNQYRSVPERNAITNIVFMGMGEPLDNVEAVIAAIRVLTEAWGYDMSSRRITLSTSGGRSGLSRILAETSVHIAVSVHTPFPDERAELVPGEGAFPLEDTLDLLATTPRSAFRKVTLEYVVLPGVNDSRRHAETLARRSRRLKATVNVIPYNPASPLPGAGRGEAADPLRAAEQFTALLAARGTAVTLRRSRGQSIGAACGMLSTAAYRQLGQRSPTSTPGAWK